jgi:hypothetical protein
MPAHLSPLHAGGALKRPHYRARWSATRATEAVRGDGDRSIKLRSTAPSHLLPPTGSGREETLGRIWGWGSSPSGLLRPREGDERTRGFKTSSKRGGRDDLVPGKELVHGGRGGARSGLQKVIDPASLGQENGRSGSTDRRQGLPLPCKTPRKKSLPSVSREGRGSGWATGSRERVCGSGMSVQWEVVALGGFINRG